MADSKQGSPRSSRSTILITLLAVIAVASVVLAAQGLLQQVSDSTHPPLVAHLSTTIKSGVVVRQVSGSVTVVPQYEWPIQRYLSPGNQPLNTRPGAAAGDVLAVGSVVATIAERPVLLLAGTVPAYRSMGVGDHGPDIGQLQDSLRTLGYKISDKPNEYGKTTALAVYHLYLSPSRNFNPVTADGGAVPPAAADTAGIPFGEVRFLPSFPVVASAPCGTQGAEAATPLCSLTGGTAAAIVTVPVADATELAGGKVVTVSQSSGATLKCTLAAEIAATAPAATTTADATPSATTSASPDTTPKTRMFALSECAGPAMTLGQTATAQIVIEQSAADSLLIEGVAVHTTPQGSSWLQNLTGKHLPITLGLCSGGICAVTGPGLKAGLSIDLPLTAAATQ